MFEYYGEIDRVVDGDTYDVKVDLGFKVFHIIRVRLKDVDTPETYGKNACEEGKAASSWVSELLLCTYPKRIKIRTYKDVATSFNRYVADVYVWYEAGQEWQDLANIIVGSGHGVRV